MNKIFLNNIGDLGEAQRASFYRFLSTGISEELANFPNPFISKIKVPTRINKRNVPCFVYLYTNDIKLKGPNYSIDNCLKRDTSYTIQIYIPGEYSYSFDEKLDIKNKEDSYLESENIIEKNKKNKIKKIRILENLNQKYELDRTSFLVKFH